DAAGEAAHRLEALRLVELLEQLRAFLFGALLLGDDRYHGGEANHLAVADDGAEARRIPVRIDPSEPLEVEADGFAASRAIEIGSHPRVVAWVHAVEEARPDDVRRFEVELRYHAVDEGDPVVEVDRQDDPGGAVDDGLDLR